MSPVYLIHMNIVCILNFRLEKLEAGARDASEFLEWQSKMKKKDFDEQMAEIERRRLAGKLSHEDAILAKQQLIAENHKKAEETRKEVNFLCKTVDEWTELFAFSSLLLCVCVCVCVCVKCGRMCVYVCVHAGMPASKQTYLHAYMNTQTCTGMCTHMPICAHARTHTHTHTPVS